ncbi:hypothetical protein ES705_32928 [subsurface metagenome]
MQLPGIRPLEEDLRIGDFLLPRLKMGAMQWPDIQYWIERKRRIPGEQNLDI